MQIDESINKVGNTCTEIEKVDKLVVKIEVEHVGHPQRVGILVTIRRKLRRGVEAGKKITCVGEKLELELWSRCIQQQRKSKRMSF